MMGRPNSPEANTKFASRLVASGVLYLLMSSGTVGTSDKRDSAEKQKQKSDHESLHSSSPSLIRLVSVAKLMKRWLFAAHSKDFITLERKR